ncbi:hypothetical protein [Fonticella tunisiensis]|uniref:Uncharacterized protein n=1 Tax=Fonticella tunisiensis TaxID=1096341 RepID=A0A4R7KUE4_9CLOT|nr:hypothetical protein [Fonticella tunisiensis]TDT62870.1 hypothetical protein EDD71_103147 [Fonticella tunisiensis]
MGAVKSPEEKLLHSYFDRLNLVPSKNMDEFLSYLCLNHDEEVVNRLEDIMDVRADGLEEKALVVI